MQDKIHLEISAIGENLEQYHRIARADMIFWGTIRPEFSPEDLVTDRILWLHDKLESGVKTLAVDTNHAQARFTRYVQGKCRNLRMKKYAETNAEVESLVDTVDESTFEATMKYLEEVKAKLKVPEDIVRLERILDGEKCKDVMPAFATLNRFRGRVRKAYNAL